MGSDGVVRELMTWEKNLDFGKTGMKDGCILFGN